MKGGLEGVGDGFFGDGEAIDTGGEAGPLGTFESEEKFVDVAMAILAAGEGGFGFLADGKGVEDVGDGLVEKGVGDREQAHKKKGGAFVVHARGVREGFAEIGAGKRGADEFERLASAHGDDGKNGDPSAEFAFAEEGEGFANAVDFGAQAERRGIEVAEQTIAQGRLLLEHLFDHGIVGHSRGNDGEQLKVDELVAWDVACLDHRRAAEKISLEIAVTKLTCLGKFVFRFHFFREQR